MADTLIRYAAEDGVAVFTIDDPPANTYTYEMMRDLDDAILRARFDESVHVIVIRGEGDRFFSAGANIKMLQTSDPYFKYFFCLHANETLSRLEHTPKLVIGALNGHTVGGGLEIALACDIRIARRDAGKIGLPEVNLGVLPGTGGTQRLGRLLGKPKAIELMAEGRTFGFEEALELGLVHEVVEPEDLEAATMNLATELANGPQVSMRLLKRSVYNAAEMNWEQSLDEIAAKTGISDHHPDSREGVQAFREKRAPSWGAH